MRFIHTADLHLGKVCEEQSLLKDQRDMLVQLLRAVEDEEPDAVIIAGDIYDQPVPSAETVHLLDEFLHQLTVELETPVLAITGNHDEAKRLLFGNRLTKENGCHIKINLQEAFTPVILNDEHGPVQFFLLPYNHPGLIRSYFGLDKIPTYADAYRMMVNHIEETRDPNSRCVLVTHAFVTEGGTAMEHDSDAEHNLPSVAGAEQVPAEIFGSFDYVALGHLHRNTHVVSEHVRYAGSPLKYSIQEEDHHKGFQLVELDGNGRLKLQQLPVNPVKNLRTVEGTLEEILLAPISEDYVFVRLLDENQVDDAMEQIRTVYPNALQMSCINSIQDTLLRECEG